MKSDDENEHPRKTLLLPSNFASLQAAKEALARFSSGGGVPVIYNKRRPIYRNTFERRVLSEERGLNLNPNAVEITSLQPSVTHGSQYVPPTNVMRSVEELFDQDEGDSDKNHVSELLTTNHGPLFRFYPKTMDGVKRTARKLRRSLKDVGLEIRLNEAYGLLARMFGFTDWQTLIKNWDLFPPSPQDKAADAEVVDARRRHQLQILTEAGLDDDTALLIINDLRP